MRLPKLENAIGIAARFLTRSFVAGETIALLIRHQAPGQTWQRIAPLERVLEPHYLGWLAHENARGANLHVGANPLRPQSLSPIGCSTRLRSSSPAECNLFDFPRQIPGAVAGSRHQLRAAGSAAQNPGSSFWRGPGLHGL